MLHNLQLTIIVQVRTPFTQAGKRDFAAAHHDGDDHDQQHSRPSKWTKGHATKCFSCFQAAHMILVHHALYLLCWLCHLTELSPVYVHDSLH